jgi:predicted NBD/HSP70 family sugar kinase
MRSAVCDPVGTVLSERYERLDITGGPKAVLQQIGEAFTAQLADRGLERSDVLGIAISVPGPVEHGSGRVVSPPIMTGWHEFDIPGWFAADYSCPVIVENDVNAMAAGEYRAHPDVDDLVFVKMGTGVGAGMILGGRLYRGADGAAGDIGHIPISRSDAEAPLCRCGNHGCVEAYAGGWAILRDLAVEGVDVTSMDALVLAVRSGNRPALQHVRAAAATVGAAVADLVNTVNPRMVVFGGQLADLDDVVLATVREVIYRRSPALATRKLSITTSSSDDPGVLGLALLVADHVFDPDRVDQIIDGLRGEA